MGLRLRDYLLMLGMLTTGAINTISKKIQLQCLAPGISIWKNATNPEMHPFNKPWLQTLFMFMGECICLMGFGIMRCRKQRKHQVLMESGADVPESSLTRNSYLSWILILPTFCDLLGTTVQGYGLIYIDASVWQMMRGSLIIFVGILSMIFLKRKLRLFNWTGISVSVIGLVLVGVSSVLKAQTHLNEKSVSTFTKAIGILLVLLGSFISSTQMVLEEALLKKRNFHPLQVVGTEGFIGMIITGIIILPIVHSIKGSDYGSFENVLDGLYMISQNHTLLVNMILYIISIAFYNYFGLSIARSLTAVHRTLIDALRTVVIWLANLFIFYAIAQKFGEKFDSTYGLLQIDGFFFLMIGTMIYNRVMNLDFIPICRFEDDSARPQAGSINTANSINTTDAERDDDPYNDEDDEKRLVSY